MPRRDSRRVRDEQGSAIIFALCMVVVVAVAGAAVLRQESNATKAQGAYESVRTREDNVDNIAEQTIQTMRLDPTAGVDATGLTGATNPCNNPNQWGSPTTTNAATGGLTILCQPDVDSGRPKGSSPNAPGSAILALGGQLQVPGNDRSLSSDPAGWNQNAYRNPFCDNWHNFQSATGNGRCEAGIYIGRAATGSDDAAGGLVIGSSNALNPDPRGEVLSNGSIIAGYSGATPRALDVQGGIWARAGCGAYHDSQPFNAGQIRAGYNGATGSKNCQQDCRRSLISTTDEFCWRFNAPNDYPLPANHDETSATNTLISDPDYVHAPIDMKNVCGAAVVGNCVPRVNNQPDPVKKGALTLDPAVLCGNTAGIAVMPANQVGTFASGEQAYAAIYDNAFDLTTFMQSATCKDTLFWFRPGVYYFDFADQNGSTAWGGPKGDIPSTLTSVAGQIIGGTPDSDLWNPCTGGNWNTTPSVLSDPAHPGQKCQQPAKIMTPDKKDFGSISKWALISNTDDVDYLDHQFAQVDVGPGNAADWVKQLGFVTAIPERQETELTSLELQLGYSLPSAANLYRDTRTNTPGAYLDISMSGGDCYIHLDPDNGHDNDVLTAPNAETPQQAVNMNGNQVFNILDGCNPADPKVISVSAGFPNPVTDCSVLPLNVANDPNCLRFHPEWVDTMNVTFNVTASALATAGNMARVRVDGMQLKAAWKGRPAPQYPNGCKISDPGVQWIFGGTSRISWGEGSNETSITELCASKTSLFPQPTGTTWTTGSQYPDDTQGHLQSVFDSFSNPPGPLVTNNDYKFGSGSDKGIAIYGLSDDNVPFPRSISTQPNEGTETTLVPQFDPSHSSMAVQDPKWTSTTAAGGNPVFADVAATGTGEAYTTNWNMTSNNQAQLAFTMPDLVAAGVPRQSIITNVQAEVVHREGDILADGTYVPGGKIQGTKPNITSVSLRINPQNAGLGQGYNGYSATYWDSDTSSVPINKSLPVCSDYINTQVPSGVDAPNHGDAHTGALTSNCTFKWGDRNATYVTNPSVGSGSCPGTAGCYKDPPWNWQRDLTDDLSTPESLSNAWVRWSVTVRGDTNCAVANACSHFAAVDKIRILVTYRPFAQQLRPLRGCLSTRTAWQPSSIVGTDPWIANHPELIAVGHDWLDWDWGYNGPSGGAATTLSDKSFGNVDDATMVGNGGSTTQDETNDCPLLDIANSPGRAKFHVQGSIYAPSAAIALSGNANDAQWATQNITARQVTALRQKNAKGIPGIGNEDVPREPRTVKIIVCDLATTPAAGCDAGHQLLSAYVKITDLPDVPGFQQQTLSWNRAAFS
ncbi:MAG TPA: hypothetical protein VL856_17020 [Acidimicrobiia bacterium]|jgi:hypothetical protein|nr:hypothetical protein [Acidimicrobiia bacterium]